MPDRNATAQPPNPDRRHLLQYAGVAALALALPSIAFAQRRSLSFVHTHTNEKLLIESSSEGGYSQESLARFNHFLRDFRTGESHVMDPALLDLLSDLRSAANHDAAFQVISAYRSPKTNAELHSKSSGVAEHSLHIEGKAIDVRLSGFATKKLHELALALKRGGVGYYAASDFVHVDTGRVRSW